MSFSTLTLVTGLPVRVVVVTVCRAGLTLKLADAEAAETTVARTPSHMPAKD
ncbi:MAG: hypothetical protein JO168_21045 [Solirubrobacterales bacterium]|nr:hypothetical protein [Solirubrobacterales bacterium]